MRIDGHKADGVYISHVQSQSVVGNGRREYSRDIDLVKHRTQKQGKINWISSETIGTLI